MPRALGGCNAGGGGGVTNGKYLSHQTFWVANKKDDLINKAQHKALQAQNFFYLVYKNYLTKSIWF